MYAKFEKLLNERKLKPADIAKATGIAPATLSAWKRGDYKPKDEKLMLIAKFLGVDIGYFYGVDKVGIELDFEELQIIGKWRDSDDLTKDMVRRILGVI